MLTPNCSLMGRTQNAVPDDPNLASHSKKSERYQLVQQITSDFWSRWCQEVNPESIIRQDWHETGHNLKPGDVVLIHYQSNIKRKYKLGVVDSVDPSCSIMSNQLCCTQYERSYRNLLRRQTCSDNSQYSETYT